MAYFQAKIGWKSQGKRENAGKERKLKLSFRSVPTWRVRENSNKIEKKLTKLRKYHYGIISSQNRLENDEKERK